MLFRSHPRNPLYASKLQLSDDVTVLSKTEKGVPLLVERKLGRGRAILLTAWNFPGEEAFDRTMRDLIGSIASEVALPVRVEPSDYINHGVFVEKGGEPGRDLTTIYFTDTRWWEPGERELPASLTLDGRAFPLKVPPARIRSVAWRGRLAVCAEDHMVYVSSLEEDSSATFTMTAQGTGTSALRLMFLDGRPKRITQAGRTVPFRWDPKTRVATMKVRWHGEDVIRVESVTKRAAR